MNENLKVEFEKMYSNEEMGNRGKINKFLVDSFEIIICSQCRTEYTEIDLMFMDDEEIREIREDGFCSRCIEN